MSGDDDFEKWRAGIMRDPMSADGAGCALELASVGAMLLGCLVTGAVLYADKAIWRQSSGVAFLLALPSIGLGIVTFFLLAPVLHRRSRNTAASRGTAGVAAESAPESAAAAPATPQAVTEVEA